MLIYTQRINKIIFILFIHKPADFIDHVDKVVVRTTTII